MRAAGLRRAARFSWDETARATLQAFDEALGFGSGDLLPGRPRGADEEAAPPRALQNGGGR
jgi:hypothetical protein